MNANSQEPHNGDFVAYLEALERRQVANLKLDHRLADIGAAAGDDDAAGPDTTHDARAERPALSRVEADALKKRLHPNRATAPLPASIVVALVIGAVLLVSAVFGDAGLGMFVIGVGLIAYALRRLIRFGRGAVDVRQTALQRVSAILDTARKR